MKTSERIENDVLVSESGRRPLHTVVHTSFCKERKQESGYVQEAESSQDGPNFGDDLDPFQPPAPSSATYPLPPVLLAVPGKVL